MEYTFADFCKIKRKQLKAAINRQMLLYDEDTDNIITYPCTKEESERIALEIFDELVYNANEFLYASKALEKVMTNHGLEVGKTFMLDEYMKARMEVQEKPTIISVK